MGQRLRVIRTHERCFLLLKSDRSTKAKTTAVRMAIRILERSAS
jgi:hypothetical protein